ncbi:MarR family winged helix-turn-helix transcriptional regulator [Sporosarcina trichiuri]|uniref:MarR family winged helix-turn-helix transcriptional regulator n=1 Tax=Sporosarcina trichiuri TaxID=3056445 RepID=UPI0025B5EF30|nr:MarR family transcriptional regulator [Sporosarcina sp. 0.2-SM1T-5]WJY28896.1 MarR family transcriptional regulator [Sporosarcina sp. 0.2-SM1T-5]
MDTANERALKLFVVLSRANKVLHEETNRLIIAKGLNPTEFAVLELLFHKGKQPIQKIGEKILMRSGSMTYVINKLEANGYLQRETNVNDKRVTYVSISEKGKRLMETIFPEHADNITSLLSALTPVEQEEAVRLLQKLGVSIRDLS